MNKKDILFYMLLFGLGAFGYGLVEILWRGFTHPSMALAGGIGFCFLAVIEKKLKPLRFLYRCITGGLLILSIEFVFGIIFNLWLGEAVWDYSMVPINFRGQICLLYAVLWCFLSVPFLFFSELIRMAVYKEPIDKKVRKREKTVT